MAAIILLAAAKAWRQERGMKHRSEGAGVVVKGSSSSQVTGKKQIANEEGMRMCIGKEHKVTTVG